MDKRFWLSTAVMFVASLALGALLYGGLMGDDFAKLDHLFRSNEECGKRMPFMLVGQLLLAGTLVWVYRQGQTKKPWLAQGLHTAWRWRCSST